mmetsp:Transcript_6846/g.11054  ORF Transcript_6846/g.11054 Transcript_6846/m.11054 type:complete len:82 (-) Transcript_6846:353-598(-)
MNKPKYDLRGSYIRSQDTSSESTAMQSTMSSLSAASDKSCSDTKYIDYFYFSVAKWIRVLMAIVPECQPKIDAIKPFLEVT